MQVVLQALKLLYCRGKWPSVANHFRMCGSKKYSYPPHGSMLEILSGRGLQQPKFLRLICKEVSGRAEFQPRLKILDRFEKPR